MVNDWKFGVKQRFNIKCGIDVAVFVVIVALVVSFMLKQEILMLLHKTVMKQ